MKKIFIIGFSALLLLTCIPIRVQANGDPVIRFSSITRSCNPIPRNIKDVEIVKEQLIIMPAIPYTSITVEYTLHNNSNKDILGIDYGFPIDYVGTTDKKWVFVGSSPSESVYETGWWDKNVKNVSFSLNDKPLSWNYAHEVLKQEHTEYEEAIEEDIFIPAKSRLWTYTVFDIKANETVLLRINYSIYHSQQMGLYPLGYTHLSRYLTSGGVINYDFEPAKYWGNGKTSDLEIIVDCKNLSDHMTFYEELYYTDSNKKDPDDQSRKATKILKRQSPNINWEGFVRDGRKWKYSCKDFDFSKAKELEISFDYQNERKATMWQAEMLFLVSPQRYSIEYKGDTVDINFVPPYPIVTDISFESNFVEKGWWKNEEVPRFCVFKAVTRADGYEEFSGETENGYYLEKDSNSGAISEGVYRLFSRSVIGISSLYLIEEGRLKQTEKYDENRKEKSIYYYRDASSDNRVKRIRLIVKQKEGYIKPLENPIRNIKVYNFSQDL